MAASDAVRLRAVRHPHQHELSALAVVLLREEVSAARGGDPGVVPLTWRCPGCGGVDHGRPLVAGSPHLDVSVAHAAGLVVVAVSAAGEVGVDVEVPDGTSGGVDLRAWVRAEAALKAAGQGLDGDAAAAAAAADVVDLDVPAAVLPAAGVSGAVAALALRR